MENILLKEFEFYIKNQDDLVKSHFGRYIIIKDNKVLGGDFGSDTEAIVYACNELNFKLGTFMVHLCMPGKENYTEYIYTY